MPRLYRTCLVTAALVLAIHLPAIGDDAAIECDLAWREASGLFAGECVESGGDEYELTLELEHPAAPRSRSDLMRALGGGIRPGQLSVPEEDLALPIGWEVKTLSGAQHIILRDPRGWFPLADIEVDEAGFRFSYSLDRMVPPTEVDLAILERADEILDGPAHWNRDDDRECEDDFESQNFSLYCALARACVEVLGGFEHRQPAMQEVRLAIDAMAGESRFEHRLKDFNNTRTFDDVKAMLARARQSVLATLQAD